MQQALLRSPLGLQSSRQHTPWSWPAHPKCLHFVHPPPAPTSPRAAYSRAPHAPEPRAQSAKRRSETLPPPTLQHAMPLPAPCDSLDPPANRHSRAALFAPPSPRHTARVLLGTPLPLSVTGRGNNRLDRGLVGLAILLGRLVLQEDILIHDSSRHAPEEGGEHVDPDVLPVPEDKRRGKRTEGVHGAASVGNRSKGAAGDGEADSEGCKGSREGDLEVRAVAGLLVNLGGKDDVDDKCSHDELPDEGGKGVARGDTAHGNELVGDVDARDGDAEADGSQDGTDRLRDDLPHVLRAIEAASQPKARRHGRVQLGARTVLA
mmetsp:Transcript_30514/g.76752  ORF Transcript_30514/g.76752 Transcript_30514/m.76752 type:complete len:320 (+) Transcript_30514:147-1106(+)